MSVSTSRAASPEGKGKDPRGHQASRIRESRSSLKSKAWSCFNGTTCSPGTISLQTVRDKNCGSRSPLTPKQLDIPDLGHFEILEAMGQAKGAAPGGMRRMGIELDRVGTHGLVLHRKGERASHSGQHVFSALGHRSDAFLANA